MITSNRIESLSRRMIDVVNQGRLEEMVSILASAESFSSANGAALSINTMDSKSPYDTPLMIACRRGYIDIVRYCLSKGMCKIYGLIFLL